MQGSVTTSEGVVSVVVNGDHIDTAKAGDLAGLEVSLDKATLRDEDRIPGGRLMLNVTMTPEVMGQIAVQMAVEAGMPAYRAPEWIQIATALEVAAGFAAPGNHHGACWQRMAREIREAYEG